MVCAAILTSCASDWEKTSPNRRATEFISLQHSILHLLPWETTGREAIVSSGHLYCGGLGKPLGRARADFVFGRSLWLTLHSAFFHCKRAMTGRPRNDLSGP